MMGTKRATAMLISDLLAALKKARDHLEYCGYGDSYERSAAVAAKLPELIDAAIAKAESEAE